MVMCENINQSWVNIFWDSIVALKPTFTLLFPIADDDSNNYSIISNGNITAKLMLSLETHLSTFIIEIGSFESFAFYYVFR